MGSNQDVASSVISSLATPELSRDEIAGVLISREAARLTALRDLDLLDTPECESFDRITRMASRLFATPVSAISLTDQNRQWFKSHVGTQGREIPRDGAPCAEVTRSRAVLVVPDLLEDPRFATSLLAQAGTRFYAGAPLWTRDGFVLGAMCVLDQKPRAVAPEELASLQDFAAMVMAQIELQHDFGRIDPLSGLPNRNQLSEDLLDLARQHSGEVRVAVLVEVESQTQIDETVNVLGTKYIDDLVRYSSRAIKDVCGRKSAIYHTGATAFVVLVNETAGESWRGVVTSLSGALAGPVLCDGVPVSLNPAFGVSPFELCEAAPYDILRTAMSAAHDARELQLNHAVYSPASDEANRRRFTLLTDIRQALNQPDQLTLSYQPRVDLRTGLCVSAEALLRWKSPTLGDVSPGEFIPLIEQTALARPLTQWVLHAALSQVSLWRKQGIDVRISINISARNLEEEDFAETVDRALKAHAVPSRAIELEFTESALIRNRSLVIGQLEQIRSQGVELAIDDFGTGYSTFSYLHKLPASTLKIDQSFIRTLAESPKDQSLVRSMIAMAHDIGFRVVAEGVETAEIYRFLAASACDEVQGYFISRPLPVAKFEHWLRHSRDEQTIAMLALLQTGMGVHATAT